MKMHVFLIFLSILATTGCEYIDKADKRLLNTNIWFTARATLNGLLDSDINSIRFDGDSMVAGIDYDAKKQTIRQVYSWREDFKDAQANGNSGAPLKVV
jgi:hypothetical protein